MSEELQRKVDELTQTVGDLHAVLQQVRDATADNERGLTELRGWFQTDHAELEDVGKLARDLSRDMSTALSTLDVEGVRKTIAGFGQRLTEWKDEWNKFSEKCDTVLVKKVEALGTQVMGLVNIGDRLTKAEKLAKAAYETGAGLVGQVDLLTKRVELLFVPKQEKKAEKPAEKAPEKAPEKKG